MRCKKNVRKRAAAAHRTNRFISLSKTHPYPSTGIIGFTFNGMAPNASTPPPQFIFAFILTVARLKSLSNDIQRKVIRRSYREEHTRLGCSRIYRKAYRENKRVYKIIRVSSILHGYWHHCGSRVFPLDTAMHESRSTAHASEQVQLMLGDKILYFLFWCSLLICPYVIMCNCTFFNCKFSSLIVMFVIVVL